MADDDSKVFASIMGSVATAFQDSDLVRLHTELFLQTTTGDCLAAYNAANARIDITDLLPRVQVPTLVIPRVTIPIWIVRVVPGGGGGNPGCAICHLH
jgi:hypothetical protein